MSGPWGALLLLAAIGVAVGLLVAYFRRPIEEVPLDDYQVTATDGVGSAGSGPAAISSDGGAGHGG